VAGREKFGFEPIEWLYNVATLLVKWAGVAQNSAENSADFIQTLQSEADGNLTALLTKTHATIERHSFRKDCLPDLGELIEKTKGGAAAGGTAVAAVATEVLPPIKIDGAELRAAYKAALSEQRCQYAQQPAHYYRKKIDEASASGVVSRPMMKAVAKETKKWLKPDDDTLPCEPGGSVFVQLDEDNVNASKFIISGGDETPLALGLFLYDMFLPAEYPQVPPLVNLQTTGSGTVRFNPNLYSDGKVCLSLLGTWHGEGRWEANKSSLYQVFLSIQGLIMGVNEPFFNEPGYEKEENTAAGDKRSREYNDVRRLATARYAIVAMLQRPPLGFEQIVVQHFTILKEAVRRQCAAWAADATSDESRRSWTHVLAQLEVELGKLESM